MVLPELKVQGKDREWQEVRWKAGRDGRPPVPVKGLDFAPEAGSREGAEPDHGFRLCD